MPPVSVSSGVLFPGGEGGAGTGGPALDHPPPLRLPGPPVPGEGTPPPHGDIPPMGTPPCPPPARNSPGGPQRTAPSTPGCPQGAPMAPCPHATPMSPSLHHHCVPTPWLCLLSPSHPHVPVPLLVSSFPCPRVPVPSLWPYLHIVPVLSPCPHTIPVSPSPHQPYAIPVSLCHTCILCPHAILTSPSLCPCAVPVCPCPTCCVAPAVPGHGVLRGGGTS